MKIWSVNTYAAKISSCITFGSCVAHLITVRPCWKAETDFCIQVSEKEVNTHIEEAHAALSGNPADMSAIYALYGYQYLLSCGIRGDNAPNNAEYLGYLNVKDLYPNIEFIKLEDYIKDALGGKAKRVYEGRLLVDTK